MPSAEPPRRYQAIAPRPPDGSVQLDAMIPGDGPLELDIGFGRGMSIFARASASPDSRLLGIEIKSKWAFKVSQRVERQGLAHVRVLCADARELLTRATPEASVSRVFVHFPDPWWKKRHAKRRVLQAGTLDQLARLLRDGGELFIQTDVEARAVEYLSELRAHTAFELAPPAGLVDVNPFASVSNRERRALDDGLPIWRILAMRRPRP